MEKDCDNKREDGRCKFTNSICRFAKGKDGNEECGNYEVPKSKVGESKLGRDLGEKIVKAMKEGFADKRLQDAYRTMIYKRAISYYGIQHQEEKAIEECSELIQALVKDIHGKEHNVEEEIADVEIVLEQLKYVFDVKKIDEFKRKKLDKLESMMNNPTD
ncbi:hypothetical protein [Clostridium kluyveri]|uniref:Uncharacterized protein n=1 Tax=Clostridium kluyveri TaxID=1534 RepID=A0A1L5F8V6_CLOKL|nr:hypothetical protein [Clostridium kluyveri]APM39419.1 hypothetical protein BS101_12035 [Clostridium kluyveri]